MSVVGLDVGYQTCVFAAPKKGGIEVLLNDYSSRTTAYVFPLPPVLTQTLQKPQSLALMRAINRSS